uniref:Uncharacterized protein n=1 Tax=Cacopsylla melanoneura TaxID=428564 RepID=A0A8D9BB82_9HEMI
MKLNLTEFQIKKIKSAYKKKVSIRVQLKHDQIGAGSSSFSLTDRQIAKLNKAKGLKKGVRIDITYNQIKTGGFLPLLFAGIGALSALAGGASAIANSYNDYKHKKVEEQEVERHNKEMEKLIANTKKVTIGLGLKKRRETKSKKKSKAKRKKI